MKLISLNIWGGRAYDALMSFVREHAADTDIFCFQEVFRSDSGIAVSRETRMNVFSEIAVALPDFQPFFRASQKNIDLKGPIDFPSEFGLAVFVRNSFHVEQEGFAPIYRKPHSLEADNWATLPHILQYVHIAGLPLPLTIASVHGTSRPGTKLDTPDRLEQSRRIVDFLAKESGAKILCGDFNLMPETESIAMIERTKMRNLINDFAITTTRSTLNYARHKEEDHQHFADYAFVSPEIKVKNFEVPQIPVSDHLPMVLEFSV